MFRCPVGLHGKPHLAGFMVLLALASLARLVFKLSDTLVAQCVQFRVEVGTLDDVADDSLGQAEGFGYLLSVRVFQE